MPRIAKELGPLAVKALTTAGLHPVGGVAGLMLQVSPTGTRSWLLRARVGSKRREIGLGAFPGVTLALAREKAQATRDEIAKGVDPVAERAAARTGCPSVKPATSGRPRRRRGAVLRWSSP